MRATGATIVQRDVYNGGGGGGGGDIAVDGVVDGLGRMLETSLRMDGYIREREERRDEH
jgi:hypothetical protein